MACQFAQIATGFRRVSAQKSPINRFEPAGGRKMPAGFAPPHWQKGDFEMEEISERDTTGNTDIAVPGTQSFDYSELGPTFDSIESLLEFPIPVCPRYLFRKRSGAAAGRGAMNASRAPPNSTKGKHFARPSGAQSFRNHQTQDISHE
jgi:hypothetical protein